MTIRRIVCEEVKSTHVIRGGKKKTFLRVIAFPVEIKRKGKKKKERETLSLRERYKLANWLAGLFRELLCISEFYGGNT